MYEPSVIAMDEILDSHPGFPCRAFALHVMGESSALSAFCLMCCEMKLGPKENNV